MPIQDSPLYDQLSSFLRKVETLVAEDIPESRRNINVRELEISVRMVNLLSNAGIYSIWDLAHVSELNMCKWRYFNSRPRMGELIDAIDKARKALMGELH